MMNQIFTMEGSGCLTISIHYKTGYLKTKQTKTVYKTGFDTISIHLGFQEGKKTLGILKKHNESVLGVEQKKIPVEKGHAAMPIS